MENTPKKPKLRSDRLSVLAYANGFTMWHFWHEESDGPLDNVDLFSGDKTLTEMIRPHDMIFAAGEESGLLVVTEVLVQSQHIKTKKLTN